MKKVSNISKIDKSKLAIIFKAYENKSLSLSEAADIAGISYKDFLDKMVENNIKVDFSSIGKDIDYFVKKTK
jgi:predicted HTH domain antitoxin